jgi:hypothetical protein
MFYKYNPDYLDCIKKEEKIKERHQKELDEQKKLRPKLELLDLSFINLYKKP